MDGVSMVYKHCFSVVYYNSHSQIRTHLFTSNIGILLKKLGLSKVEVFIWQILGPGSGWQPIPLTDVITTVAVKKAYRRATLSVHPDKLQQRGASIQQKYTCEKVFDLLKVCC